jgi:hypothetical protein
MTPEEIELVKYAIEEITKAWGFGCVVLAIGIGSISIKNIFKKEQSK